MKWDVSRSTTRGTVLLPGDKSLAHRSLLFAGMAHGRSEIKNLPEGQDVGSTSTCLRQLGVSITRCKDEVVVESSGSFAAPTSDLHAGNSGTTMRLLCGVLAGQTFRSRLVGDASLSRRPMSRVTEPLQRMGARVTTVDGHAPVEIQGNSLRGYHYDSPVASAQVKSALLLAGLYAEGQTSVAEPAASRDHTERMLLALGVPVDVKGRVAAVRGGIRPRPFHADLPGDPSSASFCFAAAVLSGGSVTAERLLLNPTRVGFLNALRHMGATVVTEVQGEEVGEPYGRVTVSGSVGRPLMIGADQVPGLIDELPLLALLATQVAGISRIEGAAELRVKETDRIDSVVSALRELGATIEGLDDGFLIQGPSRLSGGVVDSRGDHRIAMMLAVAGLVGHGPTTVTSVEAASISFPGFAKEFRGLGADIHVS